MSVFRHSALDRGEHAQGCRHDNRGEFTSEVGRWPQAPPPLAAAVEEARSWRTYVMAHAYTPAAIERAHLPLPAVPTAAEKRAAARNLRVVTLAKKHACTA